MRRKILVALVALALVINVFIPSAFGLSAQISQKVNVLPINSQVVKARLSLIGSAKDKIAKDEIDVVGSSQKCSGRGVILVAKDGENLDKLIVNIKKEVPSFRVIYRYHNVFNGVGAYVSVKDYAKLALLSGKYGLDFFPSRNYTVQGWPVSDSPNMAFSTQLIKSKDVNDEGYTGKGTVVAILDTGIRPDHEFFYKDGTEPAEGTPWQNLIGADKKFIGGYDFFGEDYCNPQPDDNPTVGPDYQSVNGHPHGTHVAGTVAGVEGTYAKGSISLKLTGVAPDAQLYIAKVFPGNPPFYASDFAIIGAVDKLIDLKKEGMNIVAANMSLGATYGFNNHNDPEQKAIEAAIKAGIAFSISAGNEGHFLGRSYPKATDTIYPLNINTVGSPGSTGDAITVAASNNSGQVVEAFEISETIDAGYGETNMVPYLTSSDSDDPAQVLSGSYEIAIADPQNLTACNASDLVDLTGKIALIKRGGCYFSTKVLNAYAKGAVGVIVYNHESGGDTFVNMALGGKAPIPAVFTWNSYGEAIKKLIESGKTVTVQFKGDATIIPMDTKSLGDFSSWGSLPSLLLKPDVAAPGVDITSAVVTSPTSYETWNGTSMAAPHVAGAIALLKQAYPDATPAEIKMALMNHADILMSQSKPWQLSPRKQGAGRINVQKAIDYFKLRMYTVGFPNEEFNGKPSVSLGVVDKFPVSFKVAVDNGMDNAVNAQVKVIAFSGATPGFGTFSASATVDKTSISLAAGASDTITVTLQDADLIGWVEGYVLLVGDNGIIASMPFAGVFNPNGPYYYGNGWKNGAMPAVDWPWWSQNRYYDYWGTRYGAKYADEKGYTALMNFRTYYTKDSNGNVLYAEYIFQPVGIAFPMMESYLWGDDIPDAYSAGYASSCSKRELEFDYDFAGHEIPYQQDLAGVSLTHVAYNLGNYILEQKDLLTLNLTAMRGIVKYAVDVVDKDGNVVYTYSTGDDLWSGVIRKGWNSSYYYNSLQDFYEYAYAIDTSTLTEGTYTVRLKVWPAPVVNPFNKQWDYQPQIIEMPITIDRHAPEFASTVDFREDTLVIYPAGYQDNETGLTGYKVYIYFDNLDDAAIPYVMYFIPKGDLPKYIDLNNIVYYDQNWDQKVAQESIEHISRVIVEADDGAHNLGGILYDTSKGFSKDFYVGGGYSLQYADRTYKLSPKAFFGADEIYKVVGGTLDPAPGKIYKVYKPKLVDASNDDVVVGGQLYLIRRSAPGYALTMLTSGYDFTAQGTIQTANKMVALGFEEDTPISAIKADANIVKIYDLYNSGANIKAYYLKPTDDFVFKKGHKYLLVFDSDTNLTIEK